MGRKRGGALADVPAIVIVVGLLVAFLQKYWLYVIALVGVALLINYVVVPAIREMASDGSETVPARKRERKHRTSRTAGSAIGSEAPEFSPVMREDVSDDGQVVLVTDWEETFVEIKRAIDAGDYDFARAWLQKFAYTVVRPEVPQRIRDQFKRLMIAFAKRDPLYQDIIPQVLQQVTAQPGMLQTAIYPLIPQCDQETLRYVLYFADALGHIRREKKGRSYRLWPQESLPKANPNSRSIVREEAIAKIDAGEVTLHASVFIARSETDERISALHKQATAHSEDNWDAAVSCLREASHLMRSQSGYPIERFLRLPLFLQRAGRFDEAMAEFERLLSETSERVARSLSRATSAGMQAAMAYERERIYDKMRLACKRQGYQGKAAEYQALSAQQAAEWERWNAAVEKERQEESAASQARWDARSQSRREIEETNDAEGQDI